MRKFPKLVASITVVLISSLLIAQENAGKGLPSLIQGNERFGRNLLLQEHGVSPKQNIVLAPLPLSVSLAAVGTYASSDRLSEEFHHVFGWARVGLQLPMRQLLAVLEPPKPIPCRHSPEARAAAKRTGVKLHCPTGIPDSAWITNTLLYRSMPKAEDPIPAYIRDSMQRDFGFTFVNTGNRMPGAQDLRKARGSALSLPELFRHPSSAKPNDVWISSGMHLKTKWRGNTFSMSTPRAGEFQSALNLPRKVMLLDSELNMYFYAKTSTFEAATLPGDLAYMLIVMPAPDTNIQQLEQELAAHPDEVDATLERRIGIVTMPVFHMVYESELTNSIKSLGITRPFQNLDGMVSIRGSHLSQIAQKVDIQVDKEGIRANSETVGGLVYGGTIAAREPFHMIVNRPFLFLIRDQTTNALMFIGALMDPAETSVIANKK
jgi:hypothetical protein